MNVIKAVVTATKTQDGLVEFGDHVKVGDTYMVDADSVETIMMFNTEYGKIHKRKWIMAYPSSTGAAGFIAMELLSLVTNEEIIH